MSARIIHNASSLKIERVTETADGQVVLATDDGAIIGFAKSADVRELMASLEQAAVLLEAREARTLVTA